MLQLGLKVYSDLDVSIISKPSTLIFCASINPSVCVLTIFPACPVGVKSPPVFTMSAKLIAVVGPNVNYHYRFYQVRVGSAMFLILSNFNPPASISIQPLVR